MPSLTELKMALRHDYLYLQEKTRWPIHINVFLTLIARILMAMAGPIAIVGTPCLVYQLYCFGINSFNGAFATIVIFSYIYFYSYSNSKQSSRSWPSIIKELSDLGRAFRVWGQDFLSILGKFADAIFRPSKVDQFLVKSVGVCRQSKISPGPYVVALSDLHVTDAESTAEGRKTVNRELRQFIRENLEIICGARAIILCGDTTDTGHPLEWLRVCSAIRNFQRKISPTDRPPILLAPGNHDINITHGGPFSSEDFWKHARNMRLLRFLLAASALNQDLMTADGKHLVDVLNEHRSQIRRYLKNPFNKEQRFLPSELWRDLFPIYQLINDELFIILDSNRDSSNALTNAIGEIGNDQLNKLVQLAKRHPKHRGHLVLHHHVVPAGRICPSYVRMNWGGTALNVLADLLYSPVNITRFVLATMYALILQPHFMRILDADKLLEKLKLFPGREFVIYHGHRHIRNHLAISISDENSAETEFLSVLSVPSTSLGDESIPDTGMQYLKVHLNPNQLDPVVID
jgi:3',5'-cyclic AMP phosphodiesterase CpdA